MHKELIETIPAMASADYRQRFVAEYEQNLIRLTKLQKTITSIQDGSCSFKPSCPLSVLIEQYYIMKTLDIVLRRRAVIEKIDLVPDDSKEETCSENS